MKIKEKTHRLPKEIYRGEISVAVTLCLKGDVDADFSLREIVNPFTTTPESPICKDRDEWSAFLAKRVSKKATPVDAN